MWFDIFHGLSVNTYSGKCANKPHSGNNVRTCVWSVLIRTPVVSGTVAPEIKRENFRDCPRVEMLHLFLLGRSKTPVIRVVRIDRREENNHASKSILKVPPPFFNHPISTLFFEKSDLHSIHYDILSSLCKFVIQFVAKSSDKL